MGTEGNLRLIRKIQPAVLVGMPTFVYHVLHTAAEEGVRCPNLRRIVLGGEKVPQYLKNRLGMQQKYLQDIRTTLGDKVLGYVPEMERDVTGLPMIERLAER